MTTPAFQAYAAHVAECDKCKDGARCAAGRTLDAIARFGRWNPAAIATALRKAEERDAQN